MELKIGILSLVYIMFFSLYLKYEPVYRRIAYRIPIIGIIIIWLFEKNKELVIWIAKRFYKYFIILMRIEIDSKIEHALRMNSKWRIINKDFPMILEKHFLNDAKEFYKAYRETLIKKRISLNKQTYDHIEYWFEIKKSFKDNIDFDSVIAVHYLLLKFLEGDKAINKSNLFRFYCITHGHPIPKPDEFSGIYQYKEIAKKNFPDNFNAGTKECQNLITFFESFKKTIKKKKYTEWIDFLNREIENEQK